MNYQVHKTVAGVIGISEENEIITRVWFGSYTGFDIMEKRETLLLVEAFRQINEYFAGNLTEFCLPLDARGTPFMKIVWNEISKIPYGKTASYTDIALAVNNPKAVRAIGLANNRNPIPIIIPCHRVIGKNGSLTGYAGGLEIKKHLLDLESGTLAVAATEATDTTVAE